jgi:hypothetical protein
MRHHACILANDVYLFFSEDEVYPNNWKRLCLRENINKVCDNVANIASWYLFEFDLIILCVASATKWRSMYFFLFIILVFFLFFYLLFLFIYLLFTFSIFIFFISDFLYFSLDEYLFPFNEIIHLGEYLFGSLSIFIFLS